MKNRTIILILFILINGGILHADSDCFENNILRLGESLGYPEIGKILSKEIEIQFKSKSFLRNQVRSMVGCLIYVGQKKWSLKKFKNVFKSKKRKLCATPAPAHGLYLLKVNY